MEIDAQSSKPFIVGFIDVGTSTEELANDVFMTCASWRAFDLTGSGGSNIVREEDMRPTGSVESCPAGIVL